MYQSKCHALIKLVFCICEMHESVTLMRFYVGCFYTVDVVFVLVHSEWPMAEYCSTNKSNDVA